MKQWWTVPGQNGAELELRDVPTPAPGAGQVLVRMAGAGVNRGELIAGRLARSDNPKARPARSGIEIAGHIEALGEGVSDVAVAGARPWATGDRVMARAQACHAEYAIVDAAALMPSPATLNDVEAAAIPNVFVTAHDAIVTTAGVTAGDVVLITAGSSGVGTAAIQIAKHLGATVVATSRSSAKSAALTELGADLVAVTANEDWLSALRRDLPRDRGRVTCVIDQVGGDLFPDLLKTLDVQGRYVSVGRNAGPSSVIDLDLVSRQRLQLLGVTFRTRSWAEALACSTRFAADLLRQFDTGALRPVVDRTFALDELPAAHAYMRSDAQLGKILLTP